MDANDIVGTRIVVVRTSEDLAPYFVFVNIVGRLINYPAAEIEKHFTEPG
jgi:hypothetical protein